MRAALFVRLAIAVLSLGIVSVTLGAIAVPAVDAAPGCNNVTPSVTESATAFAARITPVAALQSIWEYDPATNSYRGFSPAAGAPNTLTQVRRLRPVMICTSGPATLDQPPV